MNRIKNRKGFTLTEVLVSVLILGILAASFTVPYVTGFQSLEVQAEQMLLDSQLRSTMEVLMGRNFDEILALGGFSGTIVIKGKSYPLKWAAVLIDLDGDSTPEPNAMQITVEMAHRSLTTIVVNHEGRLGKTS